MTVLILNQNRLGDQIRKRCTKCKKTKLIKEFPKDISTKDGLCSWCKACISIRNKQYCQNNKEKTAIYNKQYGQINKERIAKRKRQYQQSNKEKIVIYQKQYHQENKGEITIRVKQYYQDNKEKITIRTKQHYQEHKEEIAEQKKLYRQTEKGKNADRRGVDKRRALKYGNIYEVFDSKEIFERDSYICQLCGKKTRPDYKNVYHPLYPNLDHIVPLSKGGAHTRLNTQCSCRQCNIEKHNKIIGQLRMFR